MAISFVGSAGGNAINAGSVTVTLPTGMNVDDLIIVAFGVGDDDFTQPTLAITTAGYTEVTASTLSADGGTAGDGNLAVFYKFHNGTDTNVVTTAAGTGSDSSVAVSVMVFRGVALVADGGPFDATATTATGTSGGDPNPPSITFSSSGVWTVIAGAVGNTAAITLTAPTNYTTNFQNNVGNDTFDTSVGLGYRTNPSSPEDPGVMVDSGAGAAWCAVTMALKPKVITYTYTDNFNRANSADLGSEWESGYTDNNALTLVSNAVRATEAGVTSRESLTPAPSFNNQYAQATLEIFTGASYMEAQLELRISAPASHTGYTALAIRNGSNSTLIRKDGADIATDNSITWAQGDIFRFEAEGTTLRVKQNGATVVSVVDATYSSGRVGMTIFTNATADCALDNFEAGELVSTAGLGWGYSESGWW